MVTDDFCLSLFYKDNEMINLNAKTTIFKKYPEVKDYLENRFIDTKDTSEILFRIKNKLTGPSTCIICGKPTHYNKGDKCYSKYCSAKCQNGDPQKIKKDKAAKKIKYGDEHYNNSTKNKITCLKKYGVEHYCQTDEYKENVKKRNLKKYGVEWVLQSEEIKRKGRITKKEKYGDENYNNEDKRKKTNLERYGVLNTKQYEGAKQKEKDTCLKKYGVTSYSKTQESKDKHKKTFLKHFGVEHNTKSNEWKEKWFGNREWVEKRNTHIYEKMKENGSFNNSKTEKIILEHLKKEFGVVLSQYKEERYPFKCDFYIPSLDIFIEYDGFWTHGGHDFNSNNEEDMKKLNLWKEKKNKMYNIAIKVWTLDDPQKREYAKKNNLKYIVLKYEDYKNLDKVTQLIINLSGDKSFRK